MATTCACAPNGTVVVTDEPPSCVEEAVGVALPEDVPETSGAAIGRRDPAVIWTHNDSGGEPAIYAVGRDGTLVGKVWVTGADNFDWEDMEIGQCSAGTCLYLADIGDNAEQRDEIVVYRIPEPLTTDDQSAEADVFRMRYPDRPRDAEAIFLLPGEALYVVSKGRSDAAALYRYPGALSADDVVTLERVQDVTASQPSLPGQITGASAAPDGNLVALRTYTSLRLHSVSSGLLSSEPLHDQSLRTLEEPQGEAVALGDSGLVVLTSEAAQSPRASLSLIRCEVN